LTLVYDKVESDDSGSIINMELSYSEPINAVQMFTEIPEESFVIDSNVLEGKKFSIKKIDDKYYLATKAKGIYKPKETKYALSLRSSLKSDYKDILELKENGKFKFKYFQENIDIRKRDFEFTNRAVKECINDVIPVGIFIQISPKPKTSYKIIGTGIVKKWENGFFLINGFDKNGDI
jgi:hypothetical protein